MRNHFNYLCNADGIVFVELFVLSACCYCYWKVVAQYLFLGEVGSTREQSMRYWRCSGFGCTIVSSRIVFVHTYSTTVLYGHLLLGVTSPCCLYECSLVSLWLISWNYDHSLFGSHWRR